MARIEREGSDLRRFLRLRRWSERQAAEVIEAIGRSGEPLSEFCRRNGLQYERVARWRRKLEARRQKPSGGPLLLPVRLIQDERLLDPECGSRLEPGEGSWSMELEHGELRVRVSEGTSDRLLHAVLRAARAELC